MSKNKPIESPCNGTCTMDNNICIGCKRNLDEITNWMFYDEHQKEKVVERIKIEHQPIK